ncbi:ATP-binding cassette domain-containing protein [Curvivirga aplysinae]|uniref:ATP-binding cassette domain-containing protein n=1 Tax=Curvivirga aplysinae TaxID=2529852 RepID=UPI0012BCE98F|nr:metal ABC transporter ATP-binding protein [Curvivirga aplysinae]MTI09637.1 metal ABC transporter ATP-binding protein [Curvivirga aplysinae]
MTAPLPEVLIEAKGICLAKSGKEILKNADITLRRNEIVTLIGPNGAGKSTLLEIAIGLQKADSGAVRTKKDLSVAYVPQKLAVDPIMPLTVKRLMQLTKKVSQKDATEALQKTKADHLLDEMVSDLSGGEMQRVLLARAISQKADLLVLDEPAQGVDYAGQADFYALIEKVRDEEKCGILLISHDIHIVMSATDHVVCLNGHICCAGKPETVSSDPAYKALFGGNIPNNLAIYNHHHDHEHDLDGTIVAPGESKGHEHGPNCNHSH